MVEAVEQLNSDIGISHSLSELGVKEDSIGDMATDAMKSINISVNPRQVTLEDLVGLYRQAL
ncbi:MAG: iron-containing alcohol dehydrogenase [Desulfarculaceae bacterium]|nr:iron-containing alcohol dehydrogenase [Desulfarculaceae bacterium]MCF8123573.1 iron-containing alcohol dehydrogenase [Desulfarculaceae bacterium]